jgi:hypothetical protein
MSITFRVNKTPMEKRKQNSIRIFAIILILFSVCWGGYHIKLFYDYHCTSKFFIIMLPDWILLLNIGAGFIGIYLGFLTLKSKLKPLFVFIMSLLLFLGLGILTFIVIS